MKYILILGAKSDIAKALANKYAQNGYHLILAGREIEELSDFSNNLRSTYNTSVELKYFDVLEMRVHASFFRELKVKPFGVICCVGYLGNQELATRNMEEALRIMNTNYIGCVSTLSNYIQHLDKVKGGFVIGVSSVAGERGRKSNYFYGSAKAGFTEYLSGLRAQLFSENIHVMTVKPGFVYTKMTKHLKLPKLLSIHPDFLADKVYRAQQKNKNVLYVKWIWKYIMWFIKILPEFVFKKTNL